MKFNTYIKESHDAGWRGCLMLSMPKDIAQLITVWSKNNIPDKFLAEDVGREGYSHVTVLYGFPQTVTADEVNDHVSESEIDVRLGKVKRFKANDNRPKSDVLVIEAESLKLRELNDYLTKEFDVKSAFATYNPHVTIAYIKPGVLSNLDGADVFDGLKATCDTMTYSTGNSENRTKKTLTFEEFSYEVDR